MNKTIYFLFFAILFSGCSEEPQFVKAKADQLSIKLSSDAFNSTIGTSIDKLDGYLFVDGVLARIYPNLVIDSKELKLPIVYSEGMNASLYMLANMRGVTSSLNNPSTLVVGVTTESEFPLSFEGAPQITPTPLPLGRKIDLSDINPNQPLQIKLKHTHARLNIKIEEENVEITRIDLKNLPKNGSLINEQSDPSDYTGSLFDYTENYTTPVTSSQTIGYINEGDNLNIPVTIHGRFNGAEVKMSLTLPQKLKRNSIYTIRVSKVGMTLTAIVTVEDWVDGGESNATPDVNTKVLFNPSNSVLPESVRYSATLDTLYVPSNKSSDLTLAFSADYPVEVEISGNTSGIKLNPLSGFNLFQMQVNGQQVGSPAYYSYLKIKNPFFENYYGERLVVTVAPNNNAPIADVDLLSTIPGIQLSNNLANIAAYGGSVTIPVTKLKANNRIFSSVQTMQILSSPTTPYKSIKLTRSGNNLLLTSVQNTTGESQTVTGIVSGAATDGNLISAIVSFTIPGVPANELTALNSLCVQMGSNTWMQFNTTGTYAADIQNAVAISTLGEITFDKIRANFTRFGLYKSTYDAANPCPPGFRTPSSQEFFNLFGVANAAGLSVLGSVASTPVTTSGGMKVTHALFKSAANYTGEAVVSIQKDGRTVYLTNGRYVATPSRTYFEFWQSGAFSVGQAGTNVYGWPMRCVKIANYNGLQ